LFRSTWKGAWITDRDVRLHEAASQGHELTPKRTVQQTVAVPDNDPAEDRGLDVHVRNDRPARECR
jgi:hypothetical protein